MARLDPFLQSHHHFPQKYILRRDRAITADFFPGLWIRIALVVDVAGVCRKVPSVLYTTCAAIWHDPWDLCLSQ